MTGKSAVLLGASGLVGGFCLQALLAGKDYSRIVLLNRRELPIASDPRLSQKMVDFANICSADFVDADDVFCSLGTTLRKAGSQAAFRRVDFDYPLAAAKAGLQAGAKQFVLVSSVGADPASRNFYLRTKGDLELEISKLGFQATHILRPGLLLGKRQEFRLGEHIAGSIMPLLNLTLLGRLRRYRAIAGASVGQAMVAAARQKKTGACLYEYKEILALNK